MSEIDVHQTYRIGLLVVDDILRIIESPNLVAEHTDRFLKLKERLNSDKKRTLLIVFAPKI